MATITVRRYLLIVGMALAAFVAVGYGESPGDSASAHLLSARSHDEPNKFAVSASMAVPARLVAAKKLPRFCQGSYAGAVWGTKNLVSLDPGQTARVERVDQDQIHEGKVVLAVNRQVFGGGDSPTLGSSASSKNIVMYGHEFEIQRRRRDGWLVDPASPRGPWPKSLGRLAPGEAGRCYGFKIPL